MTTIALTGATGFIGKEILHQLGEKTLLINRRKDTAYSGPQITEDFLTRPIESSMLCGVDVLIHSAAISGIPVDSSEDPMEFCRRINTEGTVQLAESAVKAGVKRFIFISSIKVNGEATSEKPFRYNDPPDPQDAYGISKNEAEQQLRELAAKTELELVIIRPPLVYGPGAKGNFALLKKLVASGVPLPFGCISGNRRSIVSLYNLVDLVITCIHNANAANQTFLVSDNEALSTASLINQIGTAMRRRGVLLPVPVFLIGIIGKLLGKKHLTDRLTGSWNLIFRIPWRPLAGSLL